MKEPKVGDVFWDAFFEDYYKVLLKDDKDLTVQYARDAVPMDYSIKVIIQTIKWGNDQPATNRDWLVARLRA